MKRKTQTTRFNRRYVPLSLTRKDRTRQRRELLKSRRLYRQKRPHYYTRKRMASFHSLPSRHVRNAMRMYKVKAVTPNAALAKASGCSVHALRQIVKKGEGAYYSSGSRPNQTAHSWAYARLGSALTGANAAKVDFHILQKGCKPGSRALRLAKKLMRQQ